MSAAPSQFSLSSEDRWPDISIDFVSVVDATACDAPARDDHLILLRFRGTSELVQRRAGQEFNPVISPGSIVVLPAGVPAFWASTSPSAYMRFNVPRELVASTASQIDGLGQGAELLNVFHARDTFIERIGTIFLAELERPEHPAQSLLISSLSQALAAHLIRHYSTASGEAATEWKGLSAPALNRVTNFIESQIEDKISLSALAEIACVSRFHFIKMFKVSTGFSPMRYVENCRIRRAQEMIRLGHMSLAEIALAVGFSDQSHFTRRFRHVVGCTPSSFAGSRVPRDPRQD